MSFKPDSNSEILIIYEVKMANPNGDPDDENRPRMDPKTKTNIVTDVRLKRFFRDYVIERYGEMKVWVSKVDGANVDATTKLSKYADEEDVLKKCVDARLFGATIPKKASGKQSKGESISFTGPLQLTWGHSLHRVDMMDTRTITSIFSGRETGSGNIGKDYRVYYSLLAFYGAFSWRRAQTTGATVNDLKVFDNFLWDALLSQSVTRSKIGHFPHLYLRVEWSDKDKFEGDLRRFIKVKEKKEAIRSLDNLELDFSALLERVKGNKVYARCSEQMASLCDKLKNTTQFTGLPHSGVTV